MPTHTQKAMGRGQLIDRLSAQVGSREKALRILYRRGDVDKDGNLTPKGSKRNNMTAGERAIDRAAKRSGRSRSSFRYNPKTNQATLRSSSKTTKKSKKKGKR